MTTELLFAAFGLAVALNGLGLVLARRGRTALHNVAFYAGLAGILAAPVLVFAFFALVAQFLFLSATSPAAIAFQAACGVLVLCGVVSTSAAIAAFRREAPQCAV